MSFIFTTVQFVIGSLKPCVKMLESGKARGRSLASKSLGLGLGMRLNHRL